MRGNLLLNNLSGYLIKKLRIFMSFFICFDHHFKILESGIVCPLGNYYFPESGVSFLVPVVPEEPLAFRQLIWFVSFDVF